LKATFIAKNMFKLLILGLVVSSCSTDSQTKKIQYFEGNIKFKNEYFIKTDKVTADYLDKIFGKTADLYFKEGNYLEIYDKGFMLEQLYRVPDNKNYIKRNGSDSLFWYSCSVPEKKMIKYEINPKKEKILGIECDEYITYYDNKTVTFYYNSDTLKINPEWYSRFTLTNKNINTSRMKAMYLKFKIEYPDFWFTVTATSITHKKIENKIFDIKQNTILIQDN
jgi:hypothetical protein